MYFLRVGVVYFGGSVVPSLFPSLSSGGRLSPNTGSRLSNRGQETRSIVDPSLGDRDTKVARNGLDREKGLGDVDYEDPIRPSQ